MKIPGANFVVFHVSDLAIAARFYRETLGLRQELYSEASRWAEFNCGHVTLVLRNGAGSRKNAIRGRIALLVENLHAARALLRRKGARIVEPKTGSTDCAVVLDPDGNATVFHERRETVSKNYSDKITFEI